MDSGNTSSTPRKQKALKPRSTPKQARSRIRVDFILDETEKLVEANGYDVVTAQMISEATKISPGVLYHYFPGKHGILAAVVQRAFERLEILMKKVGEASSDNESYESFVDRIVEALLKHWRKNQAAMLLWQALEHTPQMEPITVELKKRAIERNHRTITAYFPAMDDAEVHIKAIMMQAISIALLRETLFLKPKERKALTAETKRVLINLCC